ncbi:MAG: glycoside hydrolase family 88 protein [Rikenellaceae bacterium]|jgi:unsaturated rhamnogalacturonyl hydrolase|nr:glycoside hydrolase family 88 protein [Rikenellaceae bacterium]
MKKLIFTAMFVAGLCSLSAQPWSQKMVESHGLGDFYCNRAHQNVLGNTGWDYVGGLVANSVLKAWEMYPEKAEYYAAVKSYADRNISADGKMIITSNGRSALGPSNIDDLAAGKVFFMLYREELKKGNTTDADRYKNAATLIRNTLKSDHSRIVSGVMGAGGFYHKAQYPSQMWLDGLYMGPAVYAQWQYTFGTADPRDNTDSWTDIARQFQIINRYTYDSEKQLNYHAWAALPADSNAFWSNRTEPYMGASPEFWGRGMGWYFAALVDVLEIMPKDHPEYGAVLAIYRQVAAGLKRWQDPVSGVWFQLLQHDGSVKADGKGDIVRGKAYNVGTQANYLEASCSCMFTYAFLKGIRLGYIDKATYGLMTEKAFQGLLTTFIRPNGAKIDIIQSCASAGLGPFNNPSRTGTVNYYLAGRDVAVVENEGKAIGTFIMAALEHEMAAGK